MTQSVIKSLERFILPRLNRIPWLYFYAQTRGWAYILSWSHRITGILLFLYVCFHIYTLSLLKTPALFNSKIKLFRFFLVVLLEWALAIPVIYHALNGGRLILYESFGNREDLFTIRWVLSLSIIYVLFVGYMMILGNQIVSPILFWLWMLIISLSLCFLVAKRIWNTENSAAWKLQRVSGSFLFIMIPAHLLFMHLQPSVGHEAAVIIERMQNLFIKIVDLVLIIGVLYHGGYGLLSIAKDYIFKKGLQYVCTILIFVVIIFWAWMGITLILKV